MIPKLNEKKKAIRLRQKGKTYGEILKEVSVSKSTLSLWLRNIDLSQNSQQKLIAKRKIAQQKGGAKKREIRIEKQRRIISIAVKEIGDLTTRELFLIGATLYWAEGTKSKEHYPSCVTEFCNSDGAMIALFLRWLTDIVRVDPADITFRIHLHQTSKHRLPQVREYWSVVTGYPMSCFNTVLYKKHRVKTVRKKIGMDYNGLLSVRVKRSTDLNRRITGWIKGIIENS